MIKIYIASAFTKNKDGGNKAGVVINHSELTNQQKMAIAADLGYSETAFITYSNIADYRIEYFTPVEEVPLCGHATIASFIVLNTLKQLTKPIYTIETKSGVLEIHIKEDGTIFMEQNLPTFYDTLTFNEIDPSIPSKYISGKLPIQVVSTGLKDILLPIHSLDDLSKMEINLTNLAKLSKQKDVIGLHAFTLTHQNNLTAIVRNFAPLYGIDEESATGTSNCALACYLYHYGIKQDEYIFEQGNNLGFPSRIIVQLSFQDQNIHKVLVGGKGICIKEIELSNDDTLNLNVF